MPKPNIDIRERVLRAETVRLARETYRPADGVGWSAWLIATRRVVDELASE